MSGYKLQAELLTGELAAEEEGWVVGPHAVGAVVGLLHHLAALAPEVAAGHHLDNAEMLLKTQAFRSYCTFVCHRHVAL